MCIIAFTIVYAWVTSTFVWCSVVLRNKDKEFFCFLWL